MDAFDQVLSAPATPKGKVSLSSHLNRRVADLLAAEDLEKLTGEPAPAGFRHVRVHDLKHTFGGRLRAAGVSFEDRQDQLGHKSSRITTHYSQAELSNLIEAENRVCGDDPRKSPATTWLKRKSG